MVIEKLRSFLLRCHKTRNASDPTRYSYPETEKIV